MLALKVILTVFALSVVLPVLAYLIMKFGTAGYLRAKWRARETKTKEEETNL